MAYKAIDELERMSLENARRKALQLKTVTKERLRDALLDAYPDAEPAMVEIRSGKLYFYGTILWEKDDDEGVNINRYGLTYSEDEPQIGYHKLIFIAKLIVEKNGLL